MEVGTRFLRRTGDDALHRRPLAPVIKPSSGLIREVFCRGDAPGRVSHFLLSQDVGGQEHWENLVQASDPGRPQRKQLNYSDVVPQVKSKITAFQAQVKRRTFKKSLQKPLLHGSSLFSLLAAAA